MSSISHATQYLVDQRVPQLVSDLVQQLIASKPQEPVSFLLDLLARRQHSEGMCCSGVAASPRDFAHVAHVYPLTWMPLHKSKQHEAPFFRHSLEHSPCCKGAILPTPKPQRDSVLWLDLRGAHRAAVRKVGQFRPALPDGQGDRGNYLPPPLYKLRPRAGRPCAVCPEAVTVC